MRSQRLPFLLCGRSVRPKKNGVKAMRASSHEAVEASTKVHTTHTGGVLLVQPNYWPHDQDRDGVR